MLPFHQQLETDAEFGGPNDVDNVHGFHGPTPLIRSSDLGALDHGLRDAALAAGAAERKDCNAPVPADGSEPVSNTHRHTHTHTRTHVHTRTHPTHTRPLQHTHGLCHSALCAGGRVGMV
jgi:hypothetical protein